ncbi:amidohydrolase family protein [Streptomyces lutosisoli]|uniref:Amidohydrolase family protein n=1 Tax=Streptomyces lutosisoli TaxID=2665721 RepID=A0ABW2VSK9_9ACTN
MPGVPSLPRPSPHRGGLSPAQALRTVTVPPARLFGVDRDLGTVEEGPLADLTVVDGVPLMRRGGCCDGQGIQVSRPGPHAPAEGAGVTGSSGQSSGTLDSEWVSRDSRRITCTGHDKSGGAVLGPPPARSLTASSPPTEGCG